MADGRGDVAIGGFPRISERLKSTGKVITKVVFVDFPDFPATITPQEAFAKVTQSSDLFSELSYGKLQFTFDPYFKWYRMKETAKSLAPLNQSFTSHRAYIMEATGMADAEVDFSNADAVLVISNPDAKDIGYSGPAFTPLFGSGLFLDGHYVGNGATSAYDLNYWKYIWLNHEFGHTLGLVDLYAFNGEDSTNPYDYHRFVGEYSLMGLSSLDSNSPGYLAWERWLLDWIDDSQIYCMNERTATKLITPVERAGGLKAVVVPISKTKVVVVESRRAEGVDKNLKKAGALVYVVDSSIQSGYGPVRVYPNDKSDPRRLNSTRALGESVTVEGVTITVKGTGTDGDTVEVTNSAVAAPIQNSSPINVSWFPLTITTLPSGDLKNIPVPATNATDGDLVTKSSQTDPKIDKVTLAWRQKTTTINGVSTPVDQYKTATKPYLSQVNIYTWNVKKGEPARNAWAGPWVSGIFDRPFPSNSRFLNYVLIIYPDESVLYYFDSLIPSTDQVDSHAVARIPNKYINGTQENTLEYISAKSKELSSNVETLIKMMMDKTPAQNYGMKYTGHGAGQGGLFEVVVRRGDARRMLQDLVNYNGGKKWVYFDAGTNCDESSLTTLDDLAPYFDYILASQFERGGGEFKCKSSSEPCWDSIENSATMTLLDPYFFSDNLTFAQSMALKAKLFQSSWFWWVNKQSLTLIDSAQYMIFRKALNSAIGNSPIKAGDLAQYASNSPEPSSVGIQYDNYDLGKLIAQKYPELTKYWQSAILMHLTSQVFSGIDWEATGIYFHSYDVGAIDPKFYYDADMGLTLFKQ